MLQGYRPETWLWLSFSSFLFFPPGCNGQKINLININKFVKLWIYQLIETNVKFKAHTVPRTMQIPVHMHSKIIQIWQGHIQTKVCVQRYLVFVSYLIPCSIVGEQDGIRNRDIEFHMNISQTSHCHALKKIPSHSQCYRNEFKNHQNIYFIATSKVA